MPIAQPAVKWVRIRRGQSNPVLAGKSRPKRQRAAPKGARKFRASARCSLRYGRVEPKQAHKAACRGLGSTAKPSWTGGPRRDIPCKHASSLAALERELPACNLGPTHTKSLLLGMEPLARAMAARGARPSRMQPPPKGKGRAQMEPWDVKPWVVLTDGVV